MNPKNLLTKYQHFIKTRSNFVLVQPCLTYLTLTLVLLDAFFI